VPTLGAPPDEVPSIGLAGAVEPTVLVPASVNGLRPIVLGSSVVAVPNVLVPRLDIPEIPLPNGEEAVAVPKGVVAVSAPSDDVIIPVAEAAEAAEAGEGAVAVPSVGVVDPMKDVDPMKEAVLEAGVLGIAAPAGPMLVLGTPVTVLDEPPVLVDAVAAVDNGLGLGLVPL